MNRVDRKVLNNTSKALILALFALAGVLPVCAQDPRAEGSGPDGEDTGNRVVLVSLVDRKLAVIEDGVVIATFEVAVGADVSPSPTGEFKVINRVQNPTYYHPGVVIPGGKHNPLGTRWLGLSEKGYGIHGTNAPGSIGRAASHGCIRLRNRDIEKLFTLVKVGDMVKIRGERDEEVAQVFGGAPNETLVAEAPAADSPAGR